MHKGTSVGPTRKGQKARQPQKKPVHNVTDTFGCIRNKTRNRRILFSSLCTTSISPYNRVPSSGKEGEHKGGGEEGLTRRSVNREEQP